eukprot:gene25440-67213_t
MAVALPTPAPAFAAPYGEDPEWGALQAGPYLHPVPYSAGPYLHPVPYSAGPYLHP